MASKRQIRNTKVLLENQAYRQMLSLHRRVVRHSMKKDYINLSMYKPYYLSLYRSVNRRINLVDDVGFYNQSFIGEQVDLTLESLFKFFTNKSIPTKKKFSIQDSVDDVDVNEVFALLPFKAQKDSDYLVNTNYEQQSYISQLSDNNLTEQDIIGALLIGEKIITSKRKRWDSIIDRATRHNHALADGKTVDVNEPFVVGGELLMYPRDTSLGATAKNTANCRCRVIIV